MCIRDRSLDIGQVEVEAVELRCAANQIAYCIRFTRLQELLRPSFHNTHQQHSTMYLARATSPRWPRGDSREPARCDLPHEGADAATPLPIAPLFKKVSVGHVHPEKKMFKKIYTAQFACDSMASSFD